MSAASEHLKRSGYCAEVSPDGKDVCILQAGHTQPHQWAVKGDKHGAVNATPVGELIDALGDELQIEIAHNPHVRRHVRAVVEQLGGPWASYLDSWWLSSDAPTHRRDPDCVERWPECRSWAYDPRCCRFPKSCSADLPSDEERT